MLLDQSIKSLSVLLKKKKISSTDLVKESLKQIEKLNPQLNAFITVRNEKDILKEAKQKDNKRNMNTSIIEGIPYALKDCYLTKGIRTTCASHVLDNFIPPYSATVYQQLQAKGAILIGKNNQDSWGHGGSTENTDYQTGHNPWDANRIPGGSSGGSAIAISTRMISFAIGEDTGGSIRSPSNMCNTSGLKVTYGRVSRYGAIPYASSLDTVGPMAKSVEDLAYILELIAGKDPLDATSSSKKVENYSQYLSKSCQGKTIAFPKEFFDVKSLGKEVKQVILETKNVFESLGMKVVPINLSVFKEAIKMHSTYYLIALSETSSNLARYDAIRFGHKREDFTQETMRRIIVGTYALSSGYADKLYKKAQKARTLLINGFNDALQKCDCLISPVTPSLPAKIGELINDPLRNLLEDVYTGTINLVGVPSLSIPAGFSKNQLPIGMQIIGKKFHEAELLQIGHAYQSITNWHHQKPPLI